MDAKTLARLVTTRSSNRAAYDAARVIDLETLAPKGPLMAAAERESMRCYLDEDAIDPDPVLAELAALRPLLVVIGRLLEERLPQPFVLSAERQL